MRKLILIIYWQKKKSKKPDPEWSSPAHRPKSSIGKNRTFLGFSRSTYIYSTHIEALGFWAWSFHSGIGVSLPKWYFKSEFLCLFIWIFFVSSLYFGIIPFKIVLFSTTNMKIAEFEMSYYQIDWFGWSIILIKVTVWNLVPRKIGWTLL